MNASSPSASAPGSAGPVQRVCLTPTRNESWIIDRFVAAAQLWADRVIVADQKSTDDTFSRLHSTPGVEALVNDSPTYDEAYRQRLLLKQARSVPGRRILLGLDADEALSANFATSREWQQLADVKPGTILRFRWVNILPGFKEAWIPSTPSPFGFVDDGSDHSGTRIHSPRVPTPENAPVLDLQDVVVLHFQYVAWDRMQSKHRWYQAWEYTKHQRMGPLDIFRHYHHMHGGWDPGEMHAVRPEWIEGYDRAGIDFRHLAAEPVTWWDQEVVQMLREHGPRHFRRVDIWNKDWNDVAARLGISGGDFSDPRTPAEKFVHRFLLRTQSRRGAWSVRGFERMLRLAGW